MIRKNKYYNRSRISEVKFREIIKYFSVDLNATQIIDKCDRTTLHAIIKDKTSTDSIINSDGWRGYNGLVDFGYKKHFRVHHGKNEFARGSSHINGIESFWGYAKTRLVKFKGMNRNMFKLNLKECEFRFNNRGQDLYKSCLKVILTLLKLLCWHLLLLRILQ